MNTRSTIHSLTSTGVFSLRSGHISLKTVIAASGSVVDRSMSTARTKSNMKEYDAGGIDVNHSEYKVLAKYNRSIDYLPNVTLVSGSVLDFTTITSQGENDEAVGCIVNAANEGCLGGAGIDGAITDSGGPTLAQDRLKLPVINTPTTSNTTPDRFSSIRCRTGSSVITGPGVYGTLHVPYVVHAVGPNFLLYSNEKEANEEGYTLLRSAYHTTLDVASSASSALHHTSFPCITHIAFCLLSAGIYRGNQSLEHIINCGLSAICDWRPTSNTIETNGIATKARSNGDVANSHNATTTTTTTAASKLSEIFIFGYTELECELLVHCGEQIFNQKLP